MQQIIFAPDFAVWRRAARGALQRGLAPEEIHWQPLDSDQPALGDLFDEAEPTEPDAPVAVDATNVRVPKAFFPLAEAVACHRDPARWALLYRVLWRLTHGGEARLLDIVVDPAVHALLALEKAVRRDVHKMRAFVRFRTIASEGNETPPWYVAWFEPEHHIVERNAPFFVDRFAAMHWSILTPDRCAHWDGGRLDFSAGLPRSAAPKSDDAMESLWREYYRSIFNPARLKLRAMRREMPKRYWKNLPEAQAIPELIHAAPGRVDTMLARSAETQISSALATKKKPPAATDDDGIHPAQPPATRDLGTLRAAAATCTACPLYKNATQTVFGAGPKHAEVVFVGEQPGDVEDRAGEPFIGPAGRLLDRALAEAGILREQLYVTNAVKHFKWEPRGKRRFHRSPDRAEIHACRPWLAAELAALQPRLLVCLGATAAGSVFERVVKVTQERGTVRETEFCAQTIVTVHPSSLLRAPDEAARAAAYARFLDDLKLVAKLIETT